MNRFGRSQPVESPRYVISVNGIKTAVFRRICDVRMFVRECPERVRVRVIFPDLKSVTLIKDGE